MVYTVTTHWNTGAGLCIQLISRSGLHMQYVHIWTEKLHTHTHTHIAKTQF